MKTTEWVLITGASSGIGRHIALDLVRRGLNVFASGRREDALRSLEAEAEGQGTGRLLPVVLDVTDPVSIEQASRVINERTGGHGIDVLINNAGYGQAGPLCEMREEHLRGQFDTNVFGLMAVTRTFVPAMIARRRGRVINVSSVGGRITFPLMGAYHASKYAVESLSDAMRMELSPFGVKVVVIEPGPIRTEFVERLNESAETYKADAGSLYAPAFARANDIERRTMAMAPGPEPVAKATWHAISARSPRARYIAPWRNTAVLALLNVLPLRLRDALMRAMFGLTGRSLRPVVSPALAS